MKFLVVGAGALGGYFGARLLAAQRDVTFLLRAGRAAQLAKTGLNVKSPHGDLSLPPPPHLLSEQIAGHYDVIVVGCKAYDLEATMESFAAAVGPDTLILPLLNGMRHLDQLGARFGAERVLGGLCMISATLAADGTVLHLNDTHALVFGEPAAHASPRTDALLAAMAGAGFDARASADIVQEMWEKWIFIAAAAGATCLMRASIGDIVAAGHAELPAALLEECDAIAARQGHAARAPSKVRALSMLTAPGSPITASMMKDMERGGAIEADHIAGDMLARAAAGAAPTLTMAHAHMKTYEVRRAREARQPAGAQ
ncbi:ketopantoate reductase family protein [Rugamonas sp.]|uniref:ketopantoate reductase family protein n=1 Tax=Rugamonas sp. TaxID=1926287 RepID=UPI0025E8FC35|nr:ketopantoate reductase family protein [Rugamonas sp.]